jgi:hypothetical protein
MHVSSAGSNHRGGDASVLGALVVNRTWQWLASIHEIRWRIWIWRVTSDLMLLGSSPKGWAVVGWKASWMMSQVLEGACHSYLRHKAVFESKFGWCEWLDALDRVFVWRGSTGALRPYRRQSRKCGCLLRYVSCTAGSLLQILTTNSKKLCCSPNCFVCSRARNALIRLRW